VGARGKRRRLKTAFHLENAVRGGGMIAESCAGVGKEDRNGPEKHANPLEREKARGKPVRQGILDGRCQKNLPSEIKESVGNV